MNIFFQQVLNGLTLGSVYALVALGLTLVYGILHIPNFAHGALYMLGAYTTFFLVTTYGVHYVPAIGVAAGMGREATAVVSTLMALFVLAVLRRVEARISEKQAKSVISTDDK